MALMTPRGLKIRLGLDGGFSLLARLWRRDPRTDAFRVLKTCEAITHIPVVLSVLAGAVLAIWPAAASPLWLGAALVLGRVAGTLLTAMGRFDVVRPFGLLWLGLIWSWLPSVVRAPLIVGIPAALGFLMGWWWAIAWIVGSVSAVVFSSGLEFLIVVINKQRVGQGFTAAEIDFFNAYRLHADRLGVTRDIDVTEEEAASGDWRECLNDYAEKWPEAVARFPLGADDLELLAATSVPAGGTWE